MQLGESVLTFIFISENQLLAPQQLSSAPILNEIDTLANAC
jgi:hypothetical protein